MDWRDVILIVLGTYCVIGLLFALWFVLLGVKRIDPVAATTPLAIRVVWLPGAMLVWPLLAARSSVIVRTSNVGTTHGERAT